MSERCQSCSAEIFFALTRKGHRMPINKIPDPKGNVVVEPVGTSSFLAHVVDMFTKPEAKRYMPHHATCPQGREWRR